MDVAILNLYTWGGLGVLTRVYLQLEGFRVDTLGCHIPVPPLQVQDEHQELTPNTLVTHFKLSIPQDAPASFRTSLVSLRWVLRFEFLTVSKPAAVGWLGGGGPTSEQLSWALPILVKPSHS